ncbi:MAG: MFS transporter [Pseudomonadota bacterium]|nr:MFS transporter [Pseudomonadota bacterium]
MTAAEASLARDHARPDPRRWTALSILLVGAFLPPLDFFIVNVALPSIRGDLHASAAALQLVMSGYAVAYAVLLILGGRLGDLYGRKRMFLIGVVGFAAASALCGLAWSPNALVAGRLVQGVAAAVLAPQALASIHHLFPPTERPKALGLFGFMIGSASIVGQILAGLLIDGSALGWRAVFLVNLPVAALVAPAAWFWLPESRGGKDSRLDVGGALWLAATLSALVVPLIEGRELGWPAWSFASLAATPVLAAVFWRYETRLAARGGNPLVHPEAFRQPGLLRGLTATLVFYSMASFFLIFPMYEEFGLGYSARAAGLAFLPFGLGFLIGSQFARFAAARLGALAASAGMGTTALCMLALAYLVHRGVSLGVEPVLLVMGVGQGTAMPAMIRAVIDRVDARWSGLASGLVNATLQIGAAISVAVIGGLFFSRIGPDAHLEAIGDAFALSLICIAAALSLGAATIAGLRRRA